MTMGKMIFISVLLASGIEGLCFFMLMSGGVFFGRLAYVGITLLRPSLFISYFLFGEGGVFFAPFLAFIQFFIPILWLVARKLGRSAN